MKELLSKIVKDDKLVESFRLLYALSMRLEMEIYNKFGYEPEDDVKIREISQEVALHRGDYEIE